MRPALLAFVIASVLTHSVLWLAIAGLVITGALFHQWWTFNRPIYVRERQVVVRARRLGLAVGKPNRRK